MPRTARTHVAVFALLFPLAATAQQPAQPGPRHPALQAHGEPLVGTLLDPDGKPVAGATVQLWRREARGWACLDLVLNRESRLLRETRTSRLGAFALPMPRGLPCELHVDVPPYARLVRADVLDGHIPVLRLERGATLTGQLTIAGGGGPAADVGLRAWNGEHVEVLRGRTDAEGRYRFERLPSGAVTLAVEPPTAAATRWSHLVLESGKTLVHDLELPRGRELTGTVTDAKTGKPIAGAEVGEGWTLHKAVRTGADGRYRLQGFGGEGYHELVARAPGYGKQQLRSPDGASATADFALRRGFVVRGRVLRPDGTPAPEVYVAVIGMGSGPTGQTFDWSAARTARDGAFAVDGLRRELSHVLMLRQDGFATLVYDLPLPQGDEQRLDDMRLQPRRVLAGTVVDATGAPLAGAIVQLLGTNGDRATRLVRADPAAAAAAGAAAAAAAAAAAGGSMSLLDRYVAHRTFTTDASGRFAFGDLPAGSFMVGLQTGIVRTPIDVGAADPDPIVLRQ